MSTFPRRVKHAQPTAAAPAQPLLTRPTSDLRFDAGLNSSAAWTEHLGRELDALSLTSPTTELDTPQFGSDDDDAEHEDVHEELARGRPARVLYDFAGQTEAQELSLRAGDEIEVLRETIELAEGWSLARIPLGVDNDGADQERNDDEDERGGEVGLVPRSYYAFTTDFVSSPSDINSNAEDTNTTPRASALISPPLVPQNTGEWFRAQLQRAGRRSFLGGRSLNRFSRFVTSGAEAFILRGGPATTTVQPITASSSFPTTNNAQTDPEPEEKPQLETTTTVEGLPSDFSWRLSTYVDHTRDASTASTVVPETEPDTHFVDAGLSWRAKVPPFEVRVHSPEKRGGMGGDGGSTSDVGAYTMYSVTSTFPSQSRSSSPSSFDGEEEEVQEQDSEPPQALTVQRRFSHFVGLHNALSARLPGLALPPLPEKQYAGRFSAAFVEARRSELERYLRALVRHPVVRYAEVLTFFLGCESEVEWRRQLPLYMRRPPAGASFFANVYHPPFQFDAEDAEDIGERFENHTRAVGRGVQQLRGTYEKVRGARVGMSNAERLLSYSILSLITSTPLAGSSVFDDEDEDEDEEGSEIQSPASPNGRNRRSCRRKKGLMDADGAWCWREDCADCLRLTKCIQKTAETLQGVADLYDGHARRTMLATEDSLKDVAYPSTIYAPVLDIHKETLERYKEASVSIETESSGKAGEALASAKSEDDIVGRCETVLNSTLAEFDVYHSRKKEDFERITTSHLDGEIAFYEKILARLKTTRALFDTDTSELALTMPGARVSSVYERELRAGEQRIPAPLPQPCPHVLDASSMRPVSAAIQGLLGIGGVSEEHNPRYMNEESGQNGMGGRGSVFSRFW